MVRTKPGNFIQEYNRINVAITRAKHGLVIVGKADNLRKDEKWAQLLDAFKDNTVNGIDGARQWVQRQKVDYLRRILGSEPASQLQERQRRNPKGRRNQVPNQSSRPRGRDRK